MSKDKRVVRVNRDRIGTVVDGDQINIGKRGAVAVPGDVDHVGGRRGSTVVHGRVVSTSGDLHITRDRRDTLR